MCANFPIFGGAGGIVLNTGRLCKGSGWHDELLWVVSEAARCRHTPAGTARAPELIGRLQ